MALAGIAASVRADSCTGRRIFIDGVPSADRETIALLFEILGWQVACTGQHTSRTPCVHLHGDCLHGAGKIAKPAGPAASARARRGGARLVVTRSGAILHVGTDDPQLARQLAANGLDRLVMPVSIAALEQLCIFAS